MAYAKMQKIRNLKAVIRYGLQDYKTDSHLVTTYECEESTIEKDFEYTLKEYNLQKDQHKKMYARMIIQSYGVEDNISPEKAHELGVEMAKRYLQDNHQYIVITHEETENIHNHIVFNSVGLDLKMFDSKTKHTKHDLRAVNDEISLENGLSVIESTRNKGMTFNEYVVRSKNKSFKSKLESVIDKTIDQSKDYNDFLKRMVDQDYLPKQGKYLSFRNPSSNKYMRTKTLGFNYLESSIIFRIQNKEYEPIKKHVIDKNWIDKTQEIYKKNKGLERWATKKNINYLNEIGTKMYEQDLTLSELNALELKQENLIEAFEKQLLKNDETIFQLEKMKEAFSVYQNSYSFIKEFKAAEDKKGFKETHYTQFKAYDTAKKNMNYLKKYFNVTSQEELVSKIASLKHDRDLLYSSLDKGTKPTKEVKRTKQQDNHLDK
jgi:hypothetical protein